MLLHRYLSIFVAAREQISKWWDLAQGKYIDYNLLKFIFCITFKILQLVDY